MLNELVATRIAAGPRWPMQGVEAWRDGRDVYIRKERDDRINVLAADSYANLAEMARARPTLPKQLPPEVNQHVSAVLEPLLDLAESEPARAVTDAWTAIREITVNVYKRLRQRRPPSKVIDMVDDLAQAGALVGGWVDVAYPLYYWPIDQEHHGREPSSGEAKTYVLLATALAKALLVASGSAR
jgi:hypothetical protein